MLSEVQHIAAVLRPAPPASPFYLLLGNNPLANGLRWGPAAAVAAVGVALVRLAAVGLERRDLA